MLLQVAYVIYSASAVAGSVAQAQTHCLLRVPAAKLLLVLVLVVAVRLEAKLCHEKLYKIRASIHNARRWCNIVQVVCQNLGKGFLHRQMSRMSLCCSAAIATYADTIIGALQDTDWTASYPKMQGDKGHTHHDNVHVWILAG